MERIPQGSGCNLPLGIIFGIRSHFLNYVQKLLTHLVACWLDEGNVSTTLKSPESDNAMGPCFPTLQWQPPGMDIAPQGPRGERWLSASFTACASPMLAAHLLSFCVSGALAKLPAAVTQLPWRTCTFLASLLLLQAELQKKMSLLLGNINITERCSFSPSMMIITKDMQEDFITEHCPS